MFMEAITKFTWIITALRNAIAACGHRGAFGPVENGVTVAIHTRITRLAERFTALVEKFQSGSLAPPRRTPRNPENCQNCQNRARPAPILPAKFGLVASGGYEIRGYAGHLARFIAQPDTEALIAADPRFGRVLRPLCHLLGIKTPPGLRLPPRPRKSRPPRPAPARTAPAKTKPRLCLRPGADWLAPPSLRFQRSCGSPEPCATPPGPKITLTRWMPAPNRRSRSPP